MSTDVDLPTWVKDPDDVKDYRIDWSQELELDEDTIVTSVWTVPADLSEPTASSNDTTTATVWLSGGILGNAYVVTNHITTAGTRQMSQSIIIVIKDN